MQHVSEVRLFIVLGRLQSWPLTHGLPQSTSQQATAKEDTKDFFKRVKSRFSRKKPVKEVGLQVGLNKCSSFHPRVTAQIRRGS